MLLLSILSLYPYRLHLFATLFDTDNHLCDMLLHVNEDMSIF